MNIYISGTFAADGSSDTIYLSKGGLAFVGGAGGTDFGGGTVTVEARGPDGQWYATTEVFTEPDVKSLSFAIPVEVRLTLANATDPDLDYALQSDHVGL